RAIPTRHPHAQPRPTATQKSRRCTRSARAMWRPAITRSRSGRWTPPSSGATAPRASRSPSSHCRRRGSVSTLLAALRRLVLLVGGAAGLTAVVSLLIGLLIGASLERSLTIGFYLVGCFLLVTAFFV